MKGIFFFIFHFYDELNKIRIINYTFYDLIYIFFQIVKFHKISNALRN